MNRLVGVGSDCGALDILSGSSFSKDGRQRKDAHEFVIGVEGLQYFRAFRVGRSEPELNHAHHNNVIEECPVQTGIAVLGPNCPLVGGLWVHNAEGWSFLPSISQHDISVQRVSLCKVGDGRGRREVG